MFAVVSLFRTYSKMLTSEVGLEEREQVRYLEADRLDALTQAVWEQAMNGDLKAVEAALKISAQRHKLFGLDALNGLDHATQMNVLVVGQDKAAFIDALKQGRVAGSTRDDEDGAKEAL